MLASFATVVAADKIFNCGEFYYIQATNFQIRFISQYKKLVWVPKSWFYHFKKSFTKLQIAVGRKAATTIWNSTVRCQKNRFQSRDSCNFQWT